MMTDIDAILAEKGSFVKNAVNVLYLMKMLVYIKNLSQNSSFKRFREYMKKKWREIPHGTDQRTDCGGSGDDRTAG